MLHVSKEYLQKCLVALREICDILGIRLNEKKTQIIKISRGITFITYNVLDKLVQAVFDGIERYAKKQVEKKATEKKDENS